MNSYIECWKYDWTRRRNSCNTEGEKDRYCRGPGDQVEGIKGQDVGRWVQWYKLYYHGETNNRNGVGIILGEKLIDHELQVNRKSDRIMRIQLVIAEKKTNIISV